MIRNHNLLSGVASAVGPFSRGRLWAAHGAYGGFSLASLFAASEQGVWYDPSDLTSMYQDSAGTTAAAVGQPVGLMLDKSQGLVRGPELVTNGGFATDTTGWVGNNANATLTWQSGGTALFQNTADFAYVKSVATLSLVAGRVYEVSFDVVSKSHPAVAFHIGVGATGNNISGVGSYRYLHTATGATDFQIRPNSAGTGTIVLDNISVREIPGNHATQATTASKPILARHPVGGKRNLLTYSDEVTAARGWIETRSVLSSGAVGPDGVSLNAHKLRVDATAANSHRAGKIQSGLSAGSYTFSVALKEAELRYVQIAGLDDPASANRQYHVLFDLRDGVILGSTTINSPTGTTASIVAIGNGYYRCSVTSNNVGGTRYDNSITLSNSSSVNTNPVFDGDGVSGVLVAETQLETGSTATAYQKVVTQYDVTEAGKADLWHLAFDGFDDGMATGSINFTSTDEMTVIAGVRKLSDAAQGIIAELSANATTNNGTLALYAPFTGGNPNYGTYSRGTFPAQVGANGFAAPVTSVVSVVSEISADALSLRANGSVIATSSDDQGTGNFGNYPLYIGRRGGTSLPFNGHLYGLVARGALTAGDTLTKAEDAMNAKTGAY